MRLNDYAYESLYVRFCYDLLLVNSTYTRLVCPAEVIPLFLVPVKHQSNMGK